MPVTGSAATSVAATVQPVTPAPYVLPHCVTPVTASTLIKKVFVLVVVGSPRMIAVPALMMGKAGSLADVKDPKNG